MAGSVNTPSAAARRIDRVSMQHFVAVCGMGALAYRGLAPLTPVADVAIARIFIG